MGMGTLCCLACACPCWLTPDNSHRQTDLAHHPSRMCATMCTCVDSVCSEKPPSATCLPSIKTRSEGGTQWSASCGDGVSRPVVLGMHLRAQEPTWERPDMTLQ